MPASKFLTATDFYHYIQCPHWPYWERFGDPKDRRPLTEAEEERMSDGLEHEKKVVKEQYEEMHEVRVKNPEDAFKKTLALMKDGARAIYQGYLINEDWRGKPDILERHEGKSLLGDWYYVPIDVKRAHELKKEHKAQLTFYAVLLERIQGRFPHEPAILNADGERLSFDASEFLTEFRGLVESLERICGGEIPDPVYRKSCEDTSPWGTACFRLAKERNDIALLFNVDIRKLKGLRACGIRTVDEAAAMDPDALEGREPGLTLRGLTSAKRQAQSLQGRSVIIKKPYQHETKGLEIHFDIESHPPTDADYLYGFWIFENGAGRYVSFVAEKPEKERGMWKDFLKWLETLPSDFTVYHYAAYEPSRLAILSKRYGDEENPWLQRFVTRFVDLKEDAREHCVFPLYFYSLKQICKFLGYAWTGDVVGGAESVVAYDKWLKTKRRSVLDSIIQYNEEDVRATAFLLRWMHAYGKKETVYSEPYPWSPKS